MENQQRVKKLFGAAVRKARVQAGLSQEELADAAGLDRTYIGGVERGERNPSLLSLRKIAVGLRVTLSKLLAGMEALGK